MFPGRRILPVSLGAVVAKADVARLAHACHATVYTLLHGVIGALHLLEALYDLVKVFEKERPRKAIRTTQGPEVRDLTTGGALDRLPGPTVGGPLLEAAKTEGVETTKRARIEVTVLADDTRQEVLIQIGDQLRGRHRQEKTKTNMDTSKLSQQLQMYNSNCKCTIAIVNVLQHMYAVS